jgi:hypothetical protein
MRLCFRCDLGILKSIGIVASAYFYLMGMQNVPLLFGSLVEFLIFKRFANRHISYISYNLIIEIYTNY